MWTANREHELFMISHVVILHHSFGRCTLGRISVLYRALASLHCFTFVYKLERAKRGRRWWRGVNTRHTHSHPPKESERELKGFFYFNSCVNLPADFGVSVVMEGKWRFCAEWRLIFFKEGSYSIFCANDSNARSYHKSERQSTAIRLGQYLSAKR